MLNPVLRYLTISLLILFSNAIHAQTAELVKTDNEVISVYNTYKSLLNNIETELRLNEIEHYDQVKLRKLEIHADMLSEHLRNVAKRAYSYRFLHAVNLSSTDLQTQIDHLLKDTKINIRNINTLNTKLKNYATTEKINEQFTGKFKYFSRELIVQINDLDSALNSESAFYINFEYHLLRLQSKCFLQRKQFNLLMKTNFKLFSKENQLNQGEKTSFNNAVRETIEVKKDLISFYFRNRAEKVNWLLILFTTSLFIHFIFKSHTTNFYKKHKIDYHFGQNDGTNNILFFLFKFSIIIPLFFPQSPWIIGEMSMVLSIVIMNYLVIKSNLLSKFKWSLLALSVAFVMMSIYNLLIVNFYGETFYFILIHLLLLTATVLYYLVHRKLHRSVIDQFSILFGATFVFQVVLWIFYLAGYEGLERYLLSGLLHVLVSVYLFIFFYRINNRFFMAIAHYLIKRLPQYFENEIEQFVKILKFTMLLIIIVALSKITLSTLNIDFFIIDYIKQISIHRFHVYGHEFTLDWVFFTIILLCVSFIVARTVSFLLDYFSNQFFQHNFDFKVVAKMLIYFFAFYLFFVYSGLNLDKIAIVLSAIGFGVGFGLQNVFANIIAGIVMLTERKIKIEDRVEIEGKRGVVKEVGGRSVRIYNEDGSDLLIPSSDFISKSVRNWNLGDPNNRTEIRINITVDSDIKKAIEIIDTIILSSDKVNKKRVNNTMLVAIDNTGAHLSAFFWFEINVNEREAISEILFEITSKFKSNNIEFFQNQALKQ